MSFSSLDRARLDVEFSPLHPPDYILSAGLSAGYAIAIIIIFFALTYPANGSIGAGSLLSYWGNT